MEKVSLESKYKLGEIVFLITDVEQKPRMVTGIIFRPSGVLYELACGDAETAHFEMELATDKNFLL